jgi:hypothetical protein
VLAVEFLVKALLQIALVGLPGIERRDAWMLRLRKTDPEFQVHRPGDLTLEECSKRLAC